MRARIDDVDAIHPDSIQLFSAAQYHDREAWNAAADEEMHVPAPFDPAIAIDWLEAKALRGTRHRLVPAACCLMWYEGRPGEPEFARADTIGCAAGTTWDDAVTGALLEWIERDAMAIWWDNRLRRPGLRPESFGSPEIDEVVAGLAAIGRRLFLLDCTTDVGIPAYVSIAPRDDGSEPLISSAADLSPRRAAVRAATEVGQVVVRGAAIAFAGAGDPPLADRRNDHHRSVPRADRTDRRAAGARGRHDAGLDTDRRTARGALASRPMPSITAAPT